MAAGLLCAAAVPQLRPTDGYLPEFSRTVETPATARVRLQSDFPGGLSLDAWPVTFGVPFPRGALPEVGKARVVTSEGAEVPAQMLQTAAWHRPDGDVKWLLVDMAAQRDRQYFVEYGSQVRPKDYRSLLRVTDESGHIFVDTGRIRVSFSRTKSTLIEAAWLDRNGDRRYDEAEQVLQTRNRMFMIDQRGVRYDTSDRPEDYQVELETRGPQRVVVRARGWYRAETRKESCQYVTRVHLYAGQAFVRIIHTFVVAFDTDKTQLRDIAAPFELAGVPAAEASSPVGRGISAATRTYPLPVCLVQDRENHFSVTDGAGKMLHEGERIGGWVAATGQGVGICVGLRNMWQDYPKELEATPNGIVAHLWPRHSDRLLDFRAPGQLGPELAEKYNSTTFYRDFYKGGLGEYDQAFGIAKTNEMILALCGADPTEAQQACAALEQPPFLVADPAWMCRSDVFGPLHPRNPERFPDVETKLDLAFGRFEFLRQHLGNYGFFDYGDVNYQVGYDGSARRWVAKPWRRFASRFYGICVMPWIQFTRSGDRRFRRWAIDNARHVMDLDMCHLTNTSKEIGRFRRIRGSRYGGNGGIIHYAHGPYIIGCDSHVSQWANYYYLTGYRRAWDVMLEEADYYLDRDVHYDPTRRPYYGRHTGGAIRTMITLWNATWENKYLAMAQKLAELCYTFAAHEGKGLVRRDDVYMNPGLVTYYQATGDERMKQLFLRCMRNLNESRPPQSDDRAYSFYGPAVAYYWTGDASYLRRSVYWMRQFQEVTNVGDDPHRRGMPKDHWDMCYNSIHLHYLPYLLGALTTVNEPVRPAADQSVGSHEVWMNNPDGRAFSVEVQWRCHAATNWRAYCEKLKPRGRMVALDPDDRVVASAPMDFAMSPTGAIVSMSVPAGKPGVYRIAMEGTEAMRIRLTLLSGPFEKWVYPTAAGFVGYGDAYYFHVPADRDELTVRFKVWGLGVVPSAALLDPAGKIVKEAELDFRSSADVPWTTWKVPAPAETRGRLWSFKVRPLHAKVQEVRLRIDGVPPVVSTSPGAYFVPSPIPTVRRAELLPTPPGVKTHVRTIAATQAFGVPRGEKIGEDRYERLSVRQGTIEFWMRPDWDPDETMLYATAPRLLPARDFVQCGKLLARRTHAGVRTALASAVLATNMLLRPGVWHHIGITWDFGAEKRDRTFCFLVDGVPVGRLWGPLPKEGDWTGPAVQIRSTTGPMHITGLRISAVSRHRELEEGRLSPPPDEHTLYYDAGEGK